MRTGFTANLPMLREIVDQLSSFERVLDEGVGALDARARRVRSVWSGVAADEYSAAHTAWASGVREMGDALATLRRVVATAHDNYSSAVSANLAMWP